MSTALTIYLRNRKVLHQLSKNRALHSMAFLLTAHMHLIPTLTSPLTFSLKQLIIEVRKWLLMERGDYGSWVRHIVACPEYNEMKTYAANYCANWLQKREAPQKKIAIWTSPSFEGIKTYPSLLATILTSSTKGTSPATALRTSPSQSQSVLSVPQSGKIIYITYPRLYRPIRKKEVNVARAIV